MNWGSLFLLFVMPAVAAAARRSADQHKKARRKPRKRKAKKAPPVEVPQATAFFVPLEHRRLPKAAKLRFGYQRTPTHVHQGTDIAAPKGTPVQAVTSGEIVHASDAWQPGFSGYGRHIVLHTDSIPALKGYFGTDRLYVLFAHLDSVDVSVGQRVEAGQQLGSVGQTEFTREDKTSEFPSGPHLHIEASTTPYPMDSEAPRVNSDRLLELIAAYS